MAVQQDKHFRPMVIAAVDPTVDDDITYGYLAGFFWYNSTGGDLFICKSNANGAAVWDAVGSGGGGSISVTDGTTTVNPCSSIDFTAGATVTNAGGGVAEVAISGGGSSTIKVAVLQEEQVQGTDGGTLTSGSWQTRVLNTEKSDINNIVTIASNEFTPISGTYLVMARAPTYATGRVQARIYNVTDAAVAVIGESGYCSASDDSTTSFVTGVITTDGTKAFKLEQRAFTTSTPFGLGVDSDFTTEIYAQVVLVKI